MMSGIKEYVMNTSFVLTLSEEVKNTINILIDQLLSSTKDPNSEKVQQIIFEKQFDTLFKSLNSSSKLSVLKDFNHRSLIICFIKQQGVEHYKYSYYNRAKLTKNLVYLLEKVGPILFSEAVMIASKTNLINKNNSRFFIEDHLYTESQSPIDMKIQQILKLCDEKKRNINNNFKKLELILEGQDYLQVIKQLGKMLRDSWKKDKSKMKCVDIIKEPIKKMMLDQQYQQIGQVFQQFVQEIASQTGQRCHSQKLSFTSSQKQIIYSRKQYAKLSADKQLFEYNDSDFGAESQLFHKLQSHDFI